MNDTPSVGLGRGLAAIIPRDAGPEPTSAALTEMVERLLRQRSDEWNVLLAAERRAAQAEARAEHLATVLEDLEKVRVHRDHLLHRTAELEQRAANSESELWRTRALAGIVIAGSLGVALAGWLRRPPS